MTHPLFCWTFDAEIRFVYKSSLVSENWEEDNTGWELTHRSTFGNKSNTRWRPEYHFLGLVMNGRTTPGHTRKRRFGRVGKNWQGKKRSDNSSSECTTCDRTINKLTLQDKCKTIEMIWHKVKSHGAGSTTIRAPRGRAKSGPESGKAHHQGLYTV